MLRVDEHVGILSQISGCKDFKSKGEETYKINNITELIQCPGLKNQSE